MSPRENEPPSQEERDELGARHRITGAHGNAEAPEYEPPEGTFTCPRHGYLGYSPACAECSRDAPDWMDVQALERLLTDLTWLGETFPAVAYLTGPLHKQVAKLLAGPEDPPRHPDAYEYGEPWGPDNPAPGSPRSRGQS